MPKDVAKHFAFPNFATPLIGTLTEVLKNYITPRYKIPLNGLWMKKVKAVGAYMMLKKVTELDQDYTVFDYRPPRLQKHLKSQDRTIVAQPGMNPVPKFVLPGHSKEKFGKEPPPYVLIMDNLETLLATTVDKARDDARGSIVERFIKPRASEIFDHP